MNGKHTTQFQWEILMLRPLAEKRGTSNRPRKSVARIVWEEAGRIFSVGCLLIAIAFVACVFFI